VPARYRRRSDFPLYFSVRRTVPTSIGIAFTANLANASPAGFAVDDSHGADDSVTAFHLLACFRNFKINFDKRRQ